MLITLFKSAFRKLFGCAFFHNWDRWELYESTVFRSDSPEEKYKKLVQVRVCEDCGKIQTKDI